MLSPALPPGPQPSSPTPETESNSGSQTQGAGHAFAQALSHASSPKQSKPAKTAESHATQNHESNSHSSKAQNNRETHAGKAEQSKPAKTSDSPSETKSTSSADSAKAAEETKSESDSSKSSADAAQSVDRSKESNDPAKESNDPATANSDATVTVDTPAATTLLPDPNAAAIVTATAVTLPADADAAAVQAEAQASADASLAQTNTTAATPVTPTGAQIDIVLTDPTTASNKPVDPAAQVGATGPAQATTQTGSASLPDASVFTQAIAQSVANQVAATTQQSSDAKVINAAADGKTAALDATTVTTNPAGLNLVNTLQNNSTANQTAALAGTRANTAPAPTAAPFSQVVSVVQPLRQQPDGDYKLTLQLHPDHLGRVDISVTMHNGEISMQLSADNQNARQLLRDGMNDLRNTLESSGLQTGSLDVGNGKTDNNGQTGTNQSGNTGSSDGEEMSDSELFARLATVAPNTTSDGSLDVRV